MAVPRLAAAATAALAAAVLTACGVLSPAAPVSLDPALGHSRAEEPHGGPYSPAALAYFATIALSSEYGDGQGVVRKWGDDVRIAVHGDPNGEDLATLDAVLSDLNALIGTIDISVVDSGANADLYFAPEDQFARIAPEYVPVNMGFFWTWWDDARTITRARILISTTGITQTERDHIIREEVTQSLGLMNDSYDDEASIFYQGWTQTTAYTALDADLIEMLYLPQVAPGMSANEAIAALRGA